MEMFAAGALSGMSGVILSHPIDTIKTNIQKNGFINRNDFKNVRSLYRGILSPLCGVALEKAIVFGMYNKTQQFFENKNRNITLINAISGGIAGLSASMIVTPYERIKILLQNGNKLSGNYFKPSSLYCGLSMTFTREVPGFMIYFSVYEQLKYNFNTKQNKPISSIEAFIYGGISGGTAWIFIYPQDRIKTLIQSSTAYIKSNNILYYVKYIVNNGGFYKGFSWALYRALLLHSGTFAMMEYIIKKTKINKDHL